MGSTFFRCGVWDGFRWGGGGGLFKGSEQGLESAWRLASARSYLGRRICAGPACTCELSLSWPGFGRQTLSIPCPAEELEIRLQLDDVRSSPAASTRA